MRHQDWVSWSREASAGSAASGADSAGAVGEGRSVDAAPAAGASVDFAVGVRLGLASFVTGFVGFTGTPLFFSGLRRDPARLSLVDLAQIYELVEVEPVAVSLVFAKLVLVAHLYGVEVAHVNADSAQYAATRLISNVSMIFRLRLFSSA